ncbi:hypothetical protein [Streptomyces erythrochromogenes]|uniref:hypothetical protein n=1 Tax=Streptomyces erythrochromogenes TaxID=285574 RepID=UPI0036F83990
MDERGHLAELLAHAGVATVSAAGVLAAPGLAVGPGDSTGIRVRTTGNPPHALYTTAGSAFARLRPLIEAAARPCDGCGAEAGEPCNPGCLPDPTTD